MGWHYQLMEGLREPDTIIGNEPDDPNPPSDKLLRGIEDERTIWTGDTTAMWKTSEPVVPESTPAMEALRSVMDDIRQGAPERMLNEEPVEVKCDNRECVYRFAGVHRDVIRITILISLRYYPKTSTLEAIMDVDDGVYRASDRYNDRKTFVARTREETNNLVYMIQKEMRSRVPW